MLDRLLLIDWAVNSNKWTADVAKRVTKKLPPIVAEDEHGNMLGYLFYHKAAKTTSIVDIAVIPTEQRTGVGTFLLNTLLAEQVSSQYPTVKVVISEDRIEALAFFQKHGFKVTESCYVKQGQLSYTLEKEKEYTTDA